MPMALLALPDLVEQGNSKVPFVARQALEGMASRKRAPQRIGLAGGQEVRDLVLKFGVGGWFVRHWALGRGATPEPAGLCLAASGRLRLWVFG